MSANVSVMLTAYRRLQHFIPQLRAVQGQSVKPVDICVWHNADSRSPGPLHSGLRTITAEPNMGVWPRFLACMEFDSEYVCLLDDDTIPGSRWLENCLQQMEQQEGLYGAVGVRYQTVTRKPHSRFGWVRPSNERHEVDIVGHAWFFKRDWLRYYALEPRRAGKTCGEDMHFSVAIQRHLGLGTYVPPHPAETPELWGSLKGELGRDRVALHRQNGEEAKKAAAHDAYVASGWQLCCQRHPNLQPG